MRKYNCTCHGEPAIKETVRAHQDFQDSKSEARKQGLGTWKCSITGLRCKTGELKKGKKTQGQCSGKTACNEKRCEHLR